MKRLQAKGLGSNKRQAEPITEQEEDKLWEIGLLGDHCPQVYYNGLYFALRSGREHRQLRLRPCQIKIFEKEGERSYLRYTEDVSKNRPGGLKGRNITSKIVDHHENVDLPQWCFVRLHKKYIKNPAVNAFYLQPAAKATEKCWYTCRPLGHNTLSKTISRLCAAAGISGFKTNHSLRASTATRLYDSGIDEQLVMEQTGHRSLPGVRSYKRTSTHHREALSDILNKVPKLSNTIITSDVSLNDMSVFKSELPTSDTVPFVLSSSAHSATTSGFSNALFHQQAVEGIIYNTLHCLYSTGRFNYTCYIKFLHSCCYINHWIGSSINIYTT